MLGAHITLYAGLAIASQALAAASNVSCMPYFPVGWNTSNGKINFYDNNPTDVPYNGPGFHANTLPANATSPRFQGFRLADAGFTGGEFTFSTCNVSSLGLVNQTQSSCGHAGCYHTFYNYLQIHNLYREQDCLTINNRSANVSTLSFKPCDPNPTTRSQYFIATQTVNYQCCDYTHVTSTSGVDLSLLQDFTEQFEKRDGGPYYAWGLSRVNNRTIEMVKAAYTQIGLSAQLLKG